MVEVYLFLEGLVGVVLFTVWLHKAHRSDCRRPTGTNLFGSRQVSRTRPTFTRRRSRSHGGQKEEEDQEQERKDQDQECKNQKNPRVRKIRVRKSGAGNGCANFMDAENFCVLSAGKPPCPWNSSFGGGGGAAQNAEAGLAVLDWEEEYLYGLHLRHSVCMCVVRRLWPRMLLLYYLRSFFQISVWTLERFWGGFTGSFFPENTGETLP